MRLNTLLATTVLATGVAFQANAITLPEAVTKAVTEHPAVQGARDNQAAIGYNIDEAMAGYRPSISLQLGAGWERSYNSTTRNRAAALAGKDGDRDLFRRESQLSLSQMLFDGFSTQASVAQQKFREASAVANVAETREIVGLRAVEAYLDVLRNQELVNLAKQNVANHKKYASQIQRRVDGGRGSQADVRQSDGRLALAEANLRAFQGDLADSIAVYESVVGEAPSELSLSQGPANALPGNIQEALDRALGNNPAVVSALEDVNAAEQAVREARSNYYPQLNAEITGGLNDNLDGVEGQNNELQAMLRLRYNLYQGGADTARENERVQRLHEARSQLEEDRRSVREAMHISWNAMQTASARLAPLNQHVLSAEQTRTAYQGQFDLGQRTLLDLLDSEIEAFNARSALINGRYTAEFAAYQVLARTGDLVDTVATAN